MARSATIARRPIVAITLSLQRPHYRYGLLQEYYNGNQQLVGARPDGRCLQRYPSDCHVFNEYKPPQRHATVSFQRFAANVYGTAVGRT